MLTTQQLQTLKTHILASPDLSALPNNDDGAYAIAQLLKAPASPEFIVWRKQVLTEDVGKTIGYVALAAMTATNLDRVQTFYQLNPEEFEPRADIRSYFADAFSGALGGDGANTRAALEALWRRPANRLERLYATGTGTTQTPAALVVEGEISYQEAATARNS